MGVSQDTIKSHCFSKIDQNWHIVDSDDFPCGLISVKKFLPEIYAAYSVAELGELMKKQAYHWPIYVTVTNDWMIVNSIIGGELRASTEAGCRGLLLIHLIEKGVIKV